MIALAGEPLPWAVATGSQVTVVPWRGRAVDGWDPADMTSVFGQPTTREGRTHGRIEIGDEVEWDWGSGTGTGTVSQRFTERVTRTIKGNEIVRNASDDDPAFLIEQDDGDEVLKSASEISKVS